MKAEQALRRLTAQHVRDDRAVIATLRNVMRVTDTFHEYVPGPCDALGSPAWLRGSTRETVAWNRWNDHIERVFRATSKSRRIGEWADRFHELQHRPGPAVREDHRQCIGVARADV